MSDKTKIEYATHTWSPWRGCEPVSPGCAHCYASALGRRFGIGEYRRGMERVLTKDWEKPRKWNRQAQKCAEFCDEQQRPRVLISLCDPFDDDASPLWHARFLDLIRETPNLTWLLLTKRPENAQILNSWPDNVWLGVSAEDQQRADERIPILLSIPAKVRFISLEPLLGPINIDSDRANPIHWAIVGGESGPNHRLCEVSWIQSIADQCKAAEIPCFIKQDSHRLPGQQGRIPDDLWAIKELPQ